MATQMVVSFPPVVVYVSRCIGAAPDANSSPKFSSFKLETRLNVLDIFMGSNLGGQSYAKLAIASGQPNGPQVDPENADVVLSCGDRIAIGFQNGNGVRWRFAGYVVTAALLIEDKSEQMTYKVIGPEWPLGDPSAQGAYSLVFGQVRRGSIVDDSWSKDISRETVFEDLDILVDERCIFNPDGRGNMSSVDAVLTPNGVAMVKGRIFDEPDRKINSVVVTGLWNVLQATKILTTFYNNPKVTNIIGPRKWETLPFTEDDPMRPSDPSTNEVDCNGLPLWQALTKVLAPRFGFYIDPTPSGINGTDWGNFQINFFGRSQGTNSNTPNASLSLNPRGTPMSQADPCIVRIESARDTSKICNNVTTIGKSVAHIRLVYWGAVQLTDKQKVTALQPLWDNNADKLADYGSIDDQGNKVVNSATVEKTTDARTKWLTQYVATGQTHGNHENAFRKFGWNEAGEYDGLLSPYGPTITVPVFRPEIYEVVYDLLSKTKGFFRRRRPMMDAAFMPVNAVDDWQKQPATLYMAIASSATDSNFKSWKWKEISRWQYELDPYRAAIRFTADNLVDWKPFAKDDKDDQPTPDQKTPQDERNYATLLYSGVLRMCLEGTVEMDTPLTSTSAPDQFSGTPYYRNIFVNGGSTFLKTFVYDDDLSSPMKDGAGNARVPLSIDRTAECDAYTERLRDTGEQQSVHASITVEGDWPLQVIGSVITEISGRKIRMTSSPAGGRGAQIVAVRLDIQNGVWEYLTESAALALREKDRVRFASGTKVYSFEKKNQPMSL